MWLLRTSADENSIEIPLPLQAELLLTTLPSIVGEAW
jgi:hypothetical protein